jgi:glutamine synthetase
MKPRQVKSIEEAKQIITERELAHIKVGVFDIDGILRGKYMSKDKFFSALEHGFGFCDVVLGWDSNDQLYDNVKYTGWHTGYPDATARILPNSCREMPLEQGLFFLAEFSEQAETICPRAVLRRVLARYQALGYEPFVGFEYEFFLFNESPTSVREKNYKNLDAIAPGFFGYSVLRNSVHSEIYQQILDLSEAMDFPLEGLHEETGAGVLEAAIYVDKAQNAADKAALFKTFVKILAQKNQLMATFMARWSAEWAGQSGHIHVSLQNSAQKNVFFDANKKHQMSDLMAYFVAGQQQLMPQFLSMIAPTVNSFSRLVPGFWAPTVANWGVDNRTCALRVINGSEKSQRVEYRVSASDANPYLVLAAALASGLWGIENKTSLSEAVQGNAYEQQFPQALHLSTNLWDAAQQLKTSNIAKDYFGEAFVEHFVATREWEEREYRKHISDWELQRYFEII